ncbi:insulinase family protein [Luteolibacter flavescens]|uniref:Insulinase family protein n=1 Tax=Luteolibacter flavescens TaxID=1859460 RepID=A0ABT3FMQ3_9BACT|nr:insulinase family protein [Luteolibacter flavescens]MCW1884624.1 insulinase family protein [Luteolibacter flavescens]
MTCVVAVALVVLAIGTCHRDQPGESSPHVASGRSSKTARSDDRIATWSQRFAVQRPPPEELLPDPGQQAGVLENGMRYIVVERPDSAEEVSLRLMVLAGSMHEDEGEAGFAHFIEHLAFQETGEGNAMEAFERMGLEAGSHTNAHTALDHTLYRLDLPVADDAALETACAFLSRTAGGLTFSEAALDAERRVIQREIDERSANSRYYEEAAAILPGVPALRHRPAGTVESVTEVTREALLDFWHRHYVPSRMVVVAVGDLKAEAMTARLRRHFSDIPARPAPAEPEAGDPMAPASSPVTIMPRAATSQVTMTLAFPRPVDREPDSLAKRRQELVAQVGLAMLQNRISREFHRLKIEATSPDINAAEIIPGVGWLKVSSSFSRPELPRVARDLVLRWRAALAHEFHETEFAEARGKVRLQMRREFLSRMTDDAADLARRLADSVRTGRIVQLPEDELNWCQSQLPTITRQECEALLKAMQLTAPRVLVTGAVDDSLSKALANVVEEALTADTPRFVHGVESERWNPESPRPPGRVIRRNLDEGRGILEAELSNQVLLRLVPIPSLGGFVQVQVDVGHGSQSLPPESPALGSAARFLYKWYPLEGWPELKLNAALADEDLSRSFTVAGDSFQWHGLTDRAQLRRQLDLLASMVDRPGFAALPRTWRPPAGMRAWEDRVREGASVPSREAYRRMMGADPRHEMLPAGIMETDSDQVTDWLLPMISGDRLCVSIAGDFEPEAALAAVAASFGALPARPPWEDSSRFPLPPSPSPGETRIPLAEGVDTATVALLLPLGPAGDSAEMLRRDLLARTLQLRVREIIREKRGDSYSPYVSIIPTVEGGSEYLTISIHCAPGRTGEISETLRELVRDFRDKGWTRDEFHRALRPLPHVRARQLRSPEWVLANLMRPDRIAAPEEMELSALAEQESAVRDLARRVLDLEQALELLMDR